MFTLYNVLKYIHILCAVTWVGGAVFAQLLAIRAEHSSDPEEMVRTSRSIEFIAMRLFLPASIVLFIAGVWMVIDGPWEFDQTWIAIAIVLWLASALAGSVYIGPRTKKISQLVETEGPSSATAAALMRQVFLVSRIELVSFLVIIFLMVFKPGS